MRRRRRFDLKDRFKVVVNRWRWQRRPACPATRLRQAACRGSGVVRYDCWHERRRAEEFLLAGRVTGTVFRDRQAPGAPGGLHAPGGAERAGTRRVQSWHRVGYESYDNCFDQSVCENGKTGEQAGTSCKKTEQA